MIQSIKKKVRWLMEPKRNLVLAWCLFGLSIIGFPISVLTFAKGEPITVLGLSWLALAYTSWDIICTSTLRAEDKK